VANAVHALQRDGVTVKILTGDNELVAHHVCAQVGHDGGHVVLGEARTLPGYCPTVPQCPAAAGDAACSASVARAASGRHWSSYAAGEGPVDISAAHFALTLLTERQSFT
jgi:hypothetical protein